MKTRTIIKNYLNDIIQVVEILKTAGLKRNPKQSWKQTLYQRGEIPELDIRYSFHGLGCWVKWQHKIIDFDFRGDEDKKIWGVDPWFAAYYLQSLNIEGFTEIDKCQQKILSELQSLEASGKMIEHDSVYFFTADFKELRKSNPDLFE